MATKKKYGVQCGEKWGILRDLKVRESLMNKGIERIPFAPVNPSVVSSSLTGAAKTLKIEHFEGLFMPFFQLFAPKTSKVG